MVSSKRDLKMIKILDSENYVKEINGDLNKFILFFFQLKYLANIESLWFQTVKKKRANAAVVKSYIDLFQSRIPELVDTIINLMDVDVSSGLSLLSLRSWAFSAFWLISPSKLLLHKNIRHFEF